MLRKREKINDASNLDNSKEIEKFYFNPVCWLQNFQIGCHGWTTNHSRQKPGG